jgi:pyridoxal phosphate enzyme (YggS family)
MPLYDLSGTGAEVRERIAAAVQRGGHKQRVRVVAVTKNHPADAVTAAAAAGFRDIGENKVQEALTKQQLLQPPGNGGQKVAGPDLAGQLRWHLIGHLQRNKTKHLGSFHLFHALDSSRLANAVQAEFVRQHEADAAPAVPARLLVQVNVVGEETKGGFALDELEREADRLKGMDGVVVEGVMTMAPLDADERTLRRVFGGAREARDILRIAGHNAGELSMGMSQDYVIAVEEGATLVRLGTVLFGERPT